MRKLAFLTQFSIVIVKMSLLWVGGWLRGQSICCRNMKVWPSILSPHTKLDTIAHICNPGILTARWEVGEEHP